MLPVTAPAASPLLEAHNLERRFGAARVLRGVSLSVRAGECHLIVGPNGAGKSTLLRVLAGLARPSSGSVKLEGGRRSVGLLSHQSLLYNDLSAAENLAFSARLYGLPDAEALALARLEAVGLAERATDPVGRLSRGMVQRVALVRALLHGPRVLLLDEPFTGLDPQSSERTLALLADEQAAGRSLVLVTHDAQDAWELATHAHLLVQGRWALSGPREASLEEFLRRCREALRG